MRSTHADYFNHDDDAPGYDIDVANETHPIRHRYRSVLSWAGERVSERAAACAAARVGETGRPPSPHLLDLGCGTGDTILALPREAVDWSITAVDVSRRMIEKAQEKLPERNIAWIIDDVLHFVDSFCLDTVDGIVSTYVLHHLNPDERRRFFTILREKVRPGVPVAIGDIMFEDDSDRSRIIDLYEGDHPDLADDFEDEYFWNVSESRRMLLESGWKADWRRFSDLSWGVVLVGSRT